MHPKYSQPPPKYSSPPSTKQAKCSHPPFMKQAEHSPPPPTEHSPPPPAEHSPTEHSPTEYSPPPPTEHSPTEHSSPPPTDHSPPPPTEHSPPPPTTKRSLPPPTEHSLSPPTEHSPPPPLKLEGAEDEEISVPRIGGEQEEESQGLPELSNVHILPTIQRVLPAENSLSLPENYPEFIDSVDTIVCSHSGGIYHNPIHDITLRIPEGAIPQGEQWTISMGVCLYGDFSFPAESIIPVSPIVWLCCTQKMNAVFLKPVELIVPHFFSCDIDDVNVLNMHFMKAGHWNPLIQFEPAIGHENFTVVPKKGMLFTRHFCYICIISKDTSISREMLEFCITCAIPRQISSGARIYFYVTYFNGTCLTDMESKFEKGHIIGEQRIFRFSSVQQREPAITGDYQCSAADRHTLQPTEITEDNVNFWKLHEARKLELMHEKKLYPPYMKLTVGELPLTTETIIMSFTGIQESAAQTDIKITIPSRGEPIPTTVSSNQLHTPEEILPTLTDTPSLRQLWLLKTEPPLSLLEKLAPKWEHLGDVIHFDRCGDSVQMIKMKLGTEGPTACCRKVLQEWLRGSGDYQPPTWNGLVQILEYMDMGRLARQLHDSLST